MQGPFFLLVVFISIIGFLGWESEIIRKHFWLFAWAAERTLFMRTIF
jgi:hypothetical protein